MMESGQNRIVVEEDDRGDIFFCRGHVDRRLFVRAVLRYLGDYEPVGEIIAAIRGCGGRSAVLGRVRHVWRLPGQDCAVLGSAEDVGSEAWTTVDLGSPEGSLW